MSVRDERANNYPLSWPAGWTRTLFSQRRPSQFWRHSMVDCVDEVEREVERLQGKGLVISSNVPVRANGRPYSNQPIPSDPGVAVYFLLRGKPMALACDRWLTPEENVWAIAKHIEALRGQGRWGVGAVERAFEGYLALPPNRYADSFRSARSEQEAQAIFRKLSLTAHPDQGGSADEFVALQQAYEEARKQWG